MSENRVMRRIFGPKRVEQGEGWRKTCNEEFRICTLFTEYYVTK
jgi:hypothetical protein